MSNSNTVNPSAFEGFRQVSANVLRGESLYFSFCQLDTTGRSFNAEIMPLPRVAHEYKKKKSDSSVGF